MPNELARDPVPEVREGPRSNMYIAAVLSFGSSCCQVKVRNMSPSGALVEGAVLPSAGSPIRLTRGSLVVEGAVAWLSGGRCGVHFGSLVTVRDWIAPPNYGEQRRVDEAVSLLKAGAVPLAAAQRYRRDANPDMRTSEQLVADLTEVSYMIERMGADMCQDPQLVQRHGGHLQNLDIVTQTLGAIVEMLGKGSGSEGELAGKLQSLRASRSQALQRSGATSNA